MQWVGETIDAPITGPLDSDLDQVATPFGRDLLHVLHAMRDGDFTVRMAAGHDGLCGQIAEAVNVIAAANQRIAQHLERAGEDVGREGRMHQRVKFELSGCWVRMENQLNQMIDAVDTMVLQLSDGAAELARSKSRLQDSEDSLILALAAGKMGSWEWDVATGRCVWDARQRQLFGIDPVSIGGSAFEVAFPEVRALVDRDDWKMLCRQLKRARQNGGAWQLEFRVRRPDGGLSWCFGMAVAGKDAAGRVSRIRGITMDITERKEAEDRQLLLAREVDHRTKNALAVVHAIVSLTRADGVEQFSAAVEGRIQALARAHSLLSDSHWRGAKITDLIQGELAPLRTANPERIRMSGRSLALHPYAVQALALTVHELAANAARHGALSVPSGSVDVAWDQHEDELALQWTESGWPTAREGPVQEGLGIRIIRASVETQLCGSVAFCWHPDGLCCAIRVPFHPKPEQFGKFLYSIQNLGARRRMTS